MRSAARIEGVMVRGHWYTQAQLQTRPKALAASFMKP
jgi:hypothetical protein